jgi:hypothetical protein
LAFCLSNAAVHAEAARGSEPYVILRDRLIGDGWKPLVTNDTMADGTREKDFGDTKILADAGFAEVEWCSGTGLNYCTFNFRKNDRCMKITTQGEYDVAHNSPVLYRTQNRTCPKPEAH